MGRVFSWDQFTKNEIPTLQGFQEVIDLSRERLEGTDGVIGAILCGSCLWGTHDQRSDVDCVVLYDFQKKVDVFHALKKINAQAYTRRVPVQFICVDTDVARKGMHDVSYLFARHLDSAARCGGLIKENPIPYFAFSHTDPVQDIRDYLRHKLGSLQKGYAGFQDMDMKGKCRALQRILEVAMSLARKMLVLGGVELADDSKRVVKQKYVEVATSREYELFLRITDLDERYTEAIRRRSIVLDRRVSYGCLMRAIECEAESAIEFVRLNALRFT